MHAHTHTHKHKALSVIVSAIVQTATHIIKQKTRKEKQHDPKQGHSRCVTKTKIVPGVCTGEGCILRLGAGEPQIPVPGLLLEGGHDATEAGKAVQLRDVVPVRVTQPATARIVHLTLLVQHLPKHTPTHTVGETHAHTPTHTHKSTPKSGLQFTYEVVKTSVVAIC